MSAPRWKSGYVRDRAGFAVTLWHGDVLVMSGTARTGSEASGKALAWLDQAQAGLIPAVPERERIARLAAAPHSPPRAAQEHDLSPLPLWSDARRQQDLFG